MTITENNRVMLTINDTDPKEKQVVLIKSLASALRWYALNPDKRNEDHGYAADLSDLIHTLAD